MTDVRPAIRAAILAETDIASRLSVYEGSAAVFTRRPAPADAAYPMIIISDAISYGNQDGLKVFRDVVEIDVIAYGRVGSAGTDDDHTRRVEFIGTLLRELFHRQPRSLVNPGFHVISINAMGPRVAPTDDNSTVARVVTLTLRIQQ